MMLADVNVGLHVWTIIVGAMCAAACALPGSLLVLRRMSMMGDAISHTVLPGIAIAFMLTNSRAALPMLIGAAVVGVVTALLVEVIQRRGSTDTGAAMGIVFTTLFALGIILIRRAASADHVDLDPGCVLYGAIETSYLEPFLWQGEVVRIFGSHIPRAAVINAVIFCVNLALVFAFFKEFRISAFDPALSTTVGINARAMHYLLMVMTATTTVASFETVGSILVIAMLIVPAATAYLLTDRLRTMMVLSVLFAVAAALFGHLGAITVPTWFGFEGTSTAGSMACAAGVLFGLAWVGGPRHGVVARIVHRTRLRQRIVREDALGMLYRLEESGETLSRRDLMTTLARSLHLKAKDIGSALRTLRRQAFITVGAEGTAGHPALTARGREQARELVRTHRLWEQYLVEHGGVSPDHVHGTAMELEHLGDGDLRERLERDVGPADRDPHGRDIPPA
jgi:manganese/zinc/iron transport system permease protein